MDVLYFPLPRANILFVMFLPSLMMILLHEIIFRQILPHIFWAGASIHPPRYPRSHVQQTVQEEEKKKRKKKEKKKKKKKKEKSKS